MSFGGGYRTVELSFTDFSRVHRSTVSAVAPAFLWRRSATGFLRQSLGYWWLAWVIAAIYCSEGH